MALTKITTSVVAVNSLTTANIADNSIDATKIASNSILTRHIDDAQITTDQILDGTIATADIADDAVTEDKLANAINTSIAAKLPLAGGTLTGNVGIGVSPANKLEIQHGTVGTGNGSNNTLALRYNSTTLYGQHYMDNNGLYHIRADAQGVSGGNLILGGDASVQIWTGSTPEDRVVVDSSGKVGIGLTNQANKLQVDGDICIGKATTSGDLKSTLKMRGANGSNELQVFDLVNDGENGRVDFKYNRAGNAAQTIMSFGATVGNVGIGETSPETSLHIKNAGNSFLTLERSGTTGGTGKFGINMEGGSSQQTTMAYDDGGKLVIGRSSDPATQAGFSNDFVLDSSGKVHIGATSGTGILNVDGGSGEGSLYVEGTASGSAITARLLASDGGAVFFGSNTNHDLRIQTNGTNRMAITGAGLVGIGTTSPSQTLHVAGAKTYISNIVQGQLQVQDTTSAAAGVGGGILFTGSYSGTTTTAAASIEAAKSNGTGGHYSFDMVFKTRDNGAGAVERARFGADGGDPTYGRLRLTSSWGAVSIGAANSGYFHFSRDSGPEKFYFSNRCEASGGFHTYSDENLKKEITTLTGALDNVAKMNGVTFKWKDAANRGSGNTGKQFGVIAQNMLEVDSELPTLNEDPLYNIKDNVRETDEYYSMDYSRITPFLIEAIKELKTKLEAAEARIATLEG